MQEVSPKGIKKYYPPKSSATPKDNKKGFRQFPTVSRNVSWRVQPTILSSHILGTPPPTPGGPTGLLGSQQDNQEGNSFPGKETTSNWSPKANAQVSSKILLGLSACHYEFGKERTTWSFTFLSPPGPADRDLGEMTSIRILTLGCLLPVSPGFRRLWSEWGIPAGLILVARSSWAGGKIAESTLVIDCSSPPPPFFPTKAPHKWKSLSRLKVLAVAAVTQDYPG